MATGRTRLIFPLSIDGDRENTVGIIIREFYQCHLQKKNEILSITCIHNCFQETSLYFALPTSVLGSVTQGSLMCVLVVFSYVINKSCTIISKIVKISRCLNFISKLNLNCLKNRRLGRTW